MNLAQLKFILFKKLKLNKACDIFKLTVEHLRNAGDESLIIILNLLNNIIKNIKVLSSPQLNTSVATVVRKTGFSTQITQVSQSNTTFGKNN